MYPHIIVLLIVVFIVMTITSAKHHWYITFFSKVGYSDTGEVASTNIPLLCKHDIVASSHMSHKYYLVVLDDGTLLTNIHDDGITDYNFNSSVPFYVYLDDKFYYMKVEDKKTESAIVVASNIPGIHKGDIERTFTSSADVAWGHWTSP
jgi:hypothetical protein